MVARMGLCGKSETCAVHYVMLTLKLEMHLQFIVANQHPDGGPLMNQLTSSKLSIMFYVFLA